MKPKVGIIIPCYNEANIIQNTIERIETQINLMKNDQIIDDSLICIIDDGSKDDTWSKIISISRNKENDIHGIKFSKNYGHQNALISGIKYLSDKVDCIISIDADLEQDEKKMPEFVNKYLEGYHIVLGVRNNRLSDSVFKRVTAKFYYLITNIFDMKLEEDHADYRLISSSIAKELNNFSEVSLFLRGIIINLGYPIAKVNFDVNKIKGRKTRYSFYKMLNLGLDSITSFTIMPLRFASIFGFIAIIFAIVMIAYTFIAKLFFDIDAAGWASTVLPIYFLGGLNLIFLGIIGEYIGKIFLEVKKRPSYIIERIFKNND